MAKKTHCSRGHKQSLGNITSRGYCRLCRNANSRALYATNAVAQTGYRFKRKDALAISKREAFYGLPTGGYETLLKAQGNVCAVCYRPFLGTGRERMAPVIDHDHRNGAVRGIVHAACNKALGFIDDNAVIARQLVAYLERQ